MARQIGRGTLAKVDKKQGHAWLLYYRTLEGKNRRKVLKNPDGSNCRTKAQAEKAQAIFIEARDTGRIGKPEVPRGWGAALELFMEDLALLSGKSHCDNTRRSIELILGNLGIVELNQITAAKLLAWRTERLKKVSPNTCNHDCTALGSFTRWLKGREMIPENPLAGFRALKVTKSSQVRPMRAFTEWELGRLFEALRIQDNDRRLGNLGPLPQEWVFQGLLETGIRYGAFRQVRWSDVDLGEEPKVGVRASTAKGKRGRWVPLSKEYAAELRRQRTEQVHILKRPHGPESRVWLSARGLRLPKSDTGVLRTLNAALEIAGLEKRNVEGEALTVHSFRHTLCTRLLLAGVPPQHVMQIMGHRSIDMVMEVYNGMKDKDTRGAIDALAKVVRPASGQTPMVLPNYDPVAEHFKAKPLQDREVGS